ncbi:MAG: peptide ABC transporter substrate-binding protein [Anaerolineae bacterium]|nr:peptide ABC transporter substrate-binding protein [Anaerolineae bacterium]
MKKLFPVGSLLGVLLVAAACQPAAPGPQQAPTPAVTVITKTETVIVTATPPPAKNADTFVVALGQEPDTLHPFLATTAAARAVQAAIWEPYLSTRDYDFQPNLVESIPTLENGGARLDDKGTPDPKDDVLSVTFKLKPGVKWCDGEPVKASDFAFAFNLAADPKSGISNRSVVNKIDRVEASDPQTLIVTYKPGETTPLYHATLTPGGNIPIPEHRFKGKTAEAVLKDPDLTRKPLGYGAYCIKDWRPGDRIVLEANPHYVRSGLPKVKNLTFRITPDTSQALALLASGEVDIATPDALPASQAALYENLEKQGLIKVYPLPSATWEHLDFNLFARTNKDATERKTPHPVLGDVKVRQALAQCIDRQALIDAVYGGKSTVMNSFIPAAQKVLAAPDAELSVYKFDVNAANKLLDEAGWARGADGMRARSGVPARLSLRSTTGSVLRERATQLIRTQLARCGVDVQVDLLPATVLFGADSGVAVGDYDMGLFAWVAQADPGAQTLYACSQIPTPGNRWTGQNYMGWCSDAANKAATDTTTRLRLDERKAAYLALQKEFTRDVVSLPLFQRLEVYGTTPTLKGVKPNATAPVTENIGEWEK